jgi:hypothetical protein
MLGLNPAGLQRLPAASAGTTGAALKSLVLGLDMGSIHAHTEGTKEPGPVSDSMQLPRVKITAAYNGWLYGITRKR